MTQTVKAKTPDIELATKEFVLMINTDTEKRIETAFKDQTLYIERLFREQSKEFQATTNANNKEFQTTARWIIGLAIALFASIITLVITDLIQ